MNEIQQKKQFTKQGRPVSNFTLWVEYQDGNKFTHRGDQWRNGEEAPRIPKFREQINYLLAKLLTQRDMIVKARLYDNRKDANNTVLIEFELGFIIINKMKGYDKKWDELLKAIETRA